MQKCQLSNEVDKLWKLDAELTKDLAIAKEQKSRYYRLNDSEKKNHQQRWQSIIDVIELRQNKLNAEFSKHYLDLSKCIEKDMKGKYYAVKL